MALTEQEQALLADWNAAKDAVAAAKAREQTLRVQVVEQLGDPDKTAGTEHVDIGEGYDLTIRKTERYCVRDDDPDFHTNMLRVPAEIRKNLFLVTYHVSVSYYKSNAVTPEQRQWLACLIDIKQGMPTAEVKAPKTPQVI